MVRHVEACVFCLEFHKKEAPAARDRPTAGRMGVNTIGPIVSTERCSKPIPIIQKFQENRYRNAILNIALRWPRPASIWRLSAAPGSGWVLISVSFENCGWYLLTAGVP